MKWSATIQSVVLGCLRMIGLVFCLLAAFSLKDLIRLIADAIDAGGGYFSSYIGGEAGAIAIGLSFCIWLAAAVGLCVFGPKLAAWLTPVPGARCLSCRHRLDSANNGVCPECGASQRLC